MEAILSRTQWVNTVECKSLPGMDWVNIDILHLNPLNSHFALLYAQKKYRNLNMQSLNEIKQTAGY